ncbi:MAG TPA: diguanylate cyclase [Solimonas sp.]
MPRILQSAGYRELLRCIGTAVLIGVLCWLCIVLTRESGRIASIWLANGVLAGLMLSEQTKAWPALLISGFAGNVLAALIAGDNVPVAISLSFCNTLEVMLAAWPLRHLLGADADISDARGLAIFGCFGVLLAPAVGGTVASVALHQATGVSVWEVFSVWYPADALGVAIVMPATLAMQRSVRGGELRQMTRRGLLAPALLVAVALGAFLQNQYPLLFIVFPPMLLMVMQYRHGGAVAGLSMLAAIAIPSTVFGFGPFSLMNMSESHERILLLQVFLAVVAMTVLPMATVLTERDRMADHLAKSERDLKSVADNIPALITYVDSQQRYRFANAEAEHVFGAGQAPLIGRTVREVRGESIYSTIEPYVKRVLGGEAVRFETSQAVDGRHRHYLSNYVPDVADDGTVRGFYAMKFDITEQKQTERKLEELTRRDALSGLANRREFNEQLPRALDRARRSEAGVALLFIDIDHFKSINDRHGHAMGDAVIREVAARLQRCVRTNDIVARFAGDEFIILLESLRNCMEAQFVARKVVAAVAKEIILGEAALTPSASVGIAYVEGGDMQPADLLASADAALYQAKSAGRSTWRMSPEARGQALTATTRIVPRSL